MSEDSDEHAYVSGVTSLYERVKNKFGKDKAKSLNEIEIKSAKVSQLIHEFELLPPSPRTLHEAEELVTRGLPLVKSFSSDAAIHLLQTGSLVTEQERTGRGLGVVYASIFLNKGYGPLTAVISPAAIQEKRFQAYCVDHASTYIRDQLREKLASLPDYADQNRVEKAKIDQTLSDEIMQQYTLTPDEFKEFCTYCLASFTDHPPGYGEYSHQVEDKIRFITFDIGLPQLALPDVTDIIYKKGWGSEPVDTVAISQLTQTKNLPFSTVNQSVPFELYAQEKVTTNHLFERYHVPQKFRQAMASIA